MSVEIINKIFNNFEKPLVMQYKRYERLFEVEQIEYNKTLKTKEHFWNYLPYSEVTYHPLLPLNLFAINDYRTLDNFPFIMPIDSTLELYNFFKQSPKFFQPSLLLNKSVAPIVPDRWLEKVAFYDIVFKNKPSIESIEQRVIHGILNYETYEEDFFLKLFEENPCKKNIMYLPLRKEFYTDPHRNAEALPVPTKCLQFLYENTDQKFEFVNADKVRKLTHLENTLICPMNTGKTTRTYDVLDQHLFTKGGIPRNIEKVDNTLEYSSPIKVSEYHDICLIKDFKSMHRLTDEITHLEETFSFSNDGSLYSALIDLFRQHCHQTYYHA